MTLKRALDRITSIAVAERNPERCVMEMTLSLFMIDGNLAELIQGISSKSSHCSPTRRNLVNSLRALSCWAHTGSTSIVPMLMSQMWHILHGQEGISVNAGSAPSLYAQRHSCRTSERHVSASVALQQFQEGRIGSEGRVAQAWDRQRPPPPDLIPRLSLGSPRQGYLILYQHIVPPLGKQF